MKKNEDFTIFSFDKNFKSSDEKKQTNDSVAISNIREESLTKVFDAYSDLHTNIHGLNSKINKMIQSREGDIMNAFKTEMQIYVKELNEIKKKYQDFMRKVENDQITVELKREIAFHVDENLKLKNDISKLEIDNRKLREKVFFLEDDRKFLSEYLIRTTQKNKYSHLEKPFEIKPPHRIISSQSRPITPTKSVLNNSSKYNSARELKLENSSSSKGEDIFAFTNLIPQKNDSPKISFFKILKTIFFASRESQSIQEIYGEVEKLLKDIVLEYEDRIKRLRDDIKHTKIKLTGQMNGKLFEKNQLENFFVECIETVKTSIKKRKASHYRNRSLELDEDSSKKVKENIEFEEFMLNDKVNLLELFLDNDNIKKVIKILLFNKKESKLEMLNDLNLAYSNFPIRDPPNFSNSIIDNTLHKKKELVAESKLDIEALRFRKPVKSREKLGSIVKKIDDSSKIKKDLSIISHKRYSSID